MTGTNHNKLHRLTMRVLLAHLHLSRLVIEIPILRYLFFYRAMHFSAKRGLAIACRPSVRLSVCDVYGL